MPRLPFFKLGRDTDAILPPRLSTFIPALPLENLQVGVDNVRYDVYLSPKFVEQTRTHLARLLIRHGGVEELMAAQVATRTSPNFISGPNSKTQPKLEASDLKTTLSDQHVAALNRAKADGNPVLDLLARAAIIKFLRAALNSQFGQILERCRALLKTYEGIRPQRAIEYRERVGEFQVAKKIILRKTGQELFRTLRDIEKETLARTRRSLFGNANDEIYKLFLNPLIFTEDGHDTYLNAEHYVMFGNFDRDPDRFQNVRRVVCEFVTSLRIDSGPGLEPTLDSWLNVPENAQELVGGGGVPDESTPQGRSQKARLADWVGLLEREQLMDYVVSSYEVAPLLAEYSPRINAQQLKNALISREECMRVEKLIQEHGKLSPDSLHAAVARVPNCRGTDRAKMAGRFLRDVLRYHRDLRQLEVLNAALDSINLISKDKIRELSSVNGTLYQFLLADEQKPTEEKIVRHVIVKADIRDSSRLTRSLMERGMNPASYFSLNFYDPVNKLLSKYGATKVFLEGDAIILALLERESETSLAVSRAAVLAREIIEIVRGYNQLIERAGLPGIELGIGISYQDSAPMYLMDGDQRIMISDALNESDRLSSCSKRVRKAFKAAQTPFNVYAFQTASDEGIEDSPEDFLLKYNVSGIRMSEAAFHKLQQEISLALCKVDLTNLPKQEEYKLWSGLVPVGSDIFRKIVVRGSRVPHVETRNFTLQHWTEQWYFEVCSNPAIYAALEGAAAAGKK
jgi:class 3 adenylate cyclase